MFTTQETRPKWRRQLGRTALTLMVFSASIVTAAATASAATKQTSGTIKPDFAFFKGKTISYIVNTAAGGQAGNVITAMQPYLESYLGATINITFAGGASAYGQDIVGASSPNGLTLGDSPLGSDLSNIFNQSGTLSFSILKASFVGATFGSAYIVVACAGSPFTSYSQVINSSTLATYVNASTSSSNLYTHLLAGIYGKPHKYLNGYTASTQNPGCERGDGNLTLNSEANVLTASATSIVPGETPLLLLGEVPPGSPTAYLNKTVPSLAKFAKEYPPTTPAGKEALKLLVASTTNKTPQIASFGPAGIPKARVLALADAFKAVMTKRVVEQKLAALDVPPGYASPASIVSFLKSDLKHKPIVGRFLSS